ncbi:MAG: isoaspartyl peptidase/L-asparaginase [Nitrososphaerota archaeon]|nr:isoaspartyl peptidase/L-asparaginase [Nitrososphaerota archaeon]
MQKFGIVVHGGAGSITSSLRKDAAIRRRVLSNAVSSGYEQLRKGRSSTDAVEEAIKVLEDSNVFNAGAGSCLTLEGNIEPDAGIMNGDLSCGAVANASIAQNPISLARIVMEKTDHVFMSGREALGKLAESTGYKTYELRASKARLKEYSLNLRRMRANRDKSWTKNLKLIGKYGYGDTVGAVALDSLGCVASGVSTGGRFMKLPGRVGDSPVVGAGLYANNKSGAASATGIGEDIIRVCLCKTVCDYMKSGLEPQKATDSAIGMVSQVVGKGIAGVIAVDPMGNFGISRNTDVMPYGYKFSGMKSPKITVLEL